MSEVKKIATRASYGAALVELGKEHEDLVVLDADLAAATQTGMFKKEFEITERIGVLSENAKGWICSRTCLRADP